MFASVNGRKRRPGFEQLERRELLSGVPAMWANAGDYEHYNRDALTAEVRDGVLEIYGDNSHNIVDVEYGDFVVAPAYMQHLWVGDQPYFWIPGTAYQLAPTSITVNMITHRLVGTPYHTTHECSFERNLFEIESIQFVGWNGEDIFNNATALPSVAFGGDDRDIFIGGSGVDRFFGMDGNDTMTGNNGEDWLYGNDGDDTIRGGNDRDYIYGNKGSDHLYGNAGDDIISGGAYGKGHDTDYLWGGSGIDCIDGGDGGDYISGGPDNDFLFGGRGFDKIHGDGGDDVIFGDCRWGSGPKKELYNESIFGGDVPQAVGYGDFIWGDAGNDQIHGQYGNDHIYGGKGMDCLYGGAGNDVLDGNDGADVLYGDGPPTLPEGMKGTEATSPGHISYQECKGDEGYGNDKLFGGRGRDTLFGGWGDDHLDGDSTLKMGNTQAVDDYFGGTVADNPAFAVGNAGWLGFLGDGRADRYFRCDIGDEQTATKKCDGTADYLVGGNGVDTFVLYFTQAEFYHIVSLYGNNHWSFAEAKPNEVADFRNPLSAENWDKVEVVTWKPHVLDAFYALYSGNTSSSFTSAFNRLAGQSSAGYSPMYYM